MLSKVFESIEGIANVFLKWRLLPTTAFEPAASPLAAEINSALAAH
jgi:hypothetical protein